MDKKELKDLQDKTYAISWSGFPIGDFFNDIMKNTDPNFNKESAFQDLKKIVDEIYVLREKAKKYDDKETPKKFKIKTDKDGRTIWVCPNCGDVLMKFWSDVETISPRKYCDECGTKLEYKHVI